VTTPVDKQLAPPGGWHPYGAPRIALKEVDKLSPPMRAMLWLGGKFAVKRTGMRTVPTVFRLLMRHKGLFQPWLRFASRLMPYGTLERRDVELVILRVAWNTRSRYEWGQHVAIGLRAGLSAPEIARVGQGPGAPGWAPLQALLLRATDELHAARAIAPSTWEALAKELAPHPMIELSMLVGHYEMLAGLLNSVGLALEPQAEAMLAQADIHRAH